MKILFSNPPWWQSDKASPGLASVLRIGVRAGSRWPFTRPSAHEPDFFQPGGYLPFPFFLAYAAAYTAKEFPEARVEIRDSIARGESYRSFFEAVADLEPDWIVIESATPSWAHDKEILCALETVAPLARVILTGTLGCELTSEIGKTHRNVAAIALGEYDKQIAKVIRLYGELANPDAIRAIGPMDHDLLSLEQMEASPFPLFDEACADHYADGCPKGQSFPQLQVFTSRGCPFKCCFCVWPGVMTGNDPDGRKPRTVRLYSARYVEAMIRARLEIQRAKAPERFAFRSIYIDDDTFNLVDRHTLEISEVMGRLGLPWSAMCRADTSSPAAWEAMKKSGCFGVKLGFESGSQRVLDQIINKKLDLKEAITTAKFLSKDLGMSVHGTFTIGLPGETAAEQQETRDFIARAYQEGAINSHQLSGTAEIEGTPLSTLRRVGHLDKYPGAVMDASYHASHDGQKKIEELSRP